MSRLGGGSLLYWRADSESPGAAEAGYALETEDPGLGRQGDHHNKSNAFSDITKAQIPVRMTFYLAVAGVLAWKEFNSGQQTKRSSDMQWQTF